MATLYSIYIYSELVKRGVKRRFFSNGDKRSTTIYISLIYSRLKLLLTTIYLISLQ